MKQSDLIQYVQDNLDNFDKQIVQVQEALYAIILSKYISKFKFEDGKLVESVANYSLLNEMDRIFDEVKDKKLTGVMTRLGVKMSDLKDETATAFKSLGFKTKELDVVKNRLRFVDARIGIKGDRLVAGGFLDTLADSQEVRLALKNYVIGSVSSGATLKEFTNGFVELVKGNREVDGKLLGYMKTYVHDTFYKVQRADSLAFADKLNLKYFIYQGGIINTTRPFCKAKNGKVFTRQQAMSWTNKSWAGKNEPYDPLTDLGGYNCRHWVQWISDEQAKKMGA